MKLRALAAELAERPKAAPGARARWASCSQSFRALAVAFAVLSVLCGCGREAEKAPDRLAFEPHASGNNQCGAYGVLLDQPLRVVVEGPSKRGMLGGKARRARLQGVEVTFRIPDERNGAMFAENQSTSLVVPTDAAGVAAARLRLGRRPGAVTVLASIEGPSRGSREVALHATAGVELIGLDLEGPTGGTIPEFGVRLVEPAGNPARGVSVIFRAIGNGNKAGVGGRREFEAVTDEEGRAVTSWKLGSKASTYAALVQILDRRTDIPEEQRFHCRPIEFNAMAINMRKMVIDLLGGLAIFILGMRLMSAGLRRMADRRLKSILQGMARNRLMATAVGALFTAVIQSSSATTVMCVGFVNAGLLTLGQAIAVDYGACIGTTITAQIIAFKLNTLAFPAIGLGLIFSVASKRPWLKSLGDTILGFGLLFLGLTLMSAVLEPLRDSPTFRSWFQLFDCTPIEGGHMKLGPALMCILIGTFATMIVQSSSATIGLVMVLASQDLLTFYTAFPLVLGDNIGTTITAILASLGANRNAKRTAVAHTLFKLFGATYMYVLLFLPLWNGQPVFLGFVDYITPGDVFAPNPEDLPRHIANAHTAFNVLNVAVFLPLVPLMVRLCKKIIPVTMADEEHVLRYLEPHLLESPPLAVQQAVNEVAYMLRRSQKSINDGCEYFFKGGRALEEKIAAREVIIDRLQHDITSYLVDLSRKELRPAEAALIPALVHAVNDAERIGDHSEDLVELSNIGRGSDLKFSGTAMQDIRRLQELLNQQFDAIYRSLEHVDPGQVDCVVANENTITQLVQTSTEAHVRRLESGACEVQAGVVFLDFMAHLERVGDHLLNIGERAGKILEVTAR